MVARAAVAGGGDVAEYVVSVVLLQHADMDLASPPKYLGRLLI